MTKRKQSPPISKGNDFRWELVARPGWWFHLNRPSPAAIMGVIGKAQTKHPFPDEPTEELTDVSGNVTLSPVGPAHSDRIRWETEVGEIQQARNQYFLEFLYSTRITIEVKVDGEWVVVDEDEIVAEFKTELDDLREWTEIDDDLNDFQAVLRFILIATPEEYQRVLMASGMVQEFSDIQAEEIQKTLDSFRS